MVDKFPMFMIHKDTGMRVLVKSEEHMNDRIDEGYEPIPVENADESPAPTKNKGGRPKRVAITEE